MGEATEVCRDERDGIVERKYNIMCKDSVTTWISQADTEQMTEV